MRISSYLLCIARLLPRGGFRFLRLAAILLGELRCLPIQLNLLPGIKVKADLRESVWYPLWRYGHYPHQLGEDILALSLLRENDIVWDIGANIGYTALIFARAVGIQGSVVAFEPSAKAFKYLLRTVEERKNIRPLNLAISDFTGTLRFRESSSLDLSKVLAPCEKGGYDVTCTTLDQCLTSQGPAPNLIKIDVEGHEAAVIRGARRLISEYWPIILFEALNKDLELGIANTLKIISAREYFLYRIKKNGTLVLNDDYVAGTDYTNNYLAITPAHRGLIMNLMG